MKLLIYSHFFAPSIGGVETIVLSLAGGLAGLRDSNGAPQFEITLATQTPAGSFEDTAQPFRVVRRPGLLKLLQLIRRADVVHVAGPAIAPLFLSGISGKPVVVEHHGFQTICPNGQLLIEPAGVSCPGHFMARNHSQCLRCNSGQGWRATCQLWILTFVRRFLCARATANITPTLWLGGLLRLPHVQAVPHGLDFPQANLRAPDSRRPPVCAFVGRLVSTKGVQVLLEAAVILRAQNQPFELVIIGEGLQRAALEKFVRQAQLSAQVKFAGRLGNAEVDAALEEASVVVVPSLGGEVFGLVVAEAMARGLPVIASDVGAFSEVLGDAGLGFRTGDAADLAAALSRVLQDPALAATLGRRARQRALDFWDKSRMIQAHARVYSLLHLR